MKKSARAYGSTTAWNDASDSCISSAGCGSVWFTPAAPRKSPITAMSGLKTFEPVTAPPYTGSAPVGPAPPSAPGGTGAVGCCAGAASGVGGAAGACGAFGDGWVVAAGGDPVGG